MRGARLLVLVLVLVPLPVSAGCSRTPKTTDTATATDAAPAVVLRATAAHRDATADDAIAPPTEGEHLYEGTLGESTRITVHFTRARDDLRGTYTYAAMGRPLALQGTVEPGGALVLDESVDGKKTGVLRLRPAGAGLTGEWSDPAGKRVYPVRLSPLRSTDPGADAGAGASPTFEKQARECLAEVSCPASEAARLFVASDDAKERELECYRFVDGAGAPRDLARARACLERLEVGSCEGSSASMEREMLAVMRIDGLGGRTDIAGARQLFDKCFDDVTKDAVFEYAGARELALPATKKDACDLGGTTLVWEQCAARKSESERTRGQLAAKAGVATLDPTGKRLFDVATKAYAEYVRAKMLYVYDVYSGGSIRYALAMGEERELVQKRAGDLAVFSTFKAKPASEADAVKAATLETAALGSDVKPGSPYATTESTWRTYRDAEIDLYVHVFGPAQGRDEVRRALMVMLSERRMAEQAAPNLGN